MQLAYVFLFLFAFLLGDSATAKDLVIGQVGTFSNPERTAINIKNGIELALDAVNSSGGVNGQTIKLATRDRKSDAADAVRVTRELVKEEQPIALIGLMGTGPMEEMLRQNVVADAGLPIIGIRTGAMSIREPFNQWLFHTRASYSDEAYKIVQYLWTIGYRRFGVFHENTVFGREGLNHVKRALAERSLSSPCTADYEANSSNMKAPLAKMAECKPDAIVAVGSSNPTADFYAALRTARWNGPVIAMSTVDAGTVVRRIGKDAAYGLGISRVVPDPENRRSALARDFQDVAKRLRGKDFVPDQAALEGYVAARVLIEGLKRAGPSPTPAKLKSALETIHDMDLGGVIVSFNKGSHVGTRFVDVGILNRNGRMLQ